MFDKRLYWIVNLLILTFFIISTGCMVLDSDSNTSQQQSSFNEADSTQTPTVHNATIPTTKIVDTVTATPTLSPGLIFTETGSTTDANGTPILSKSQAWNYAEKYLESYGLTNILSEEVKASEPKLFTDKENNQTLIWTFEIDRKDSMEFERGGIIAIDAYNGDVVWYAEFT